MSLTWPVTVDDDFLSATPIRLVQAGSVAQVPVLIGMRSLEEPICTVFTPPLQAMWRTKVHCSLWELPTLRTYACPIPIFSSTKPCIRTDAEARECVHKYMENAPDAEVDRVMNLYPNGNGFLESYSFRR